MKKLLIISIVLAVIGLGVNGFAQTGIGMGHHDKGAGHSMMMQKDFYKNTSWYAQLSPERQKAIQNIIDNERQDITGIRLEMKVKKSELNLLMFKEQASEKEKKEIDKLITDIDRLRSEAYKKRINIAFALKNAGAPYSLYGLKNKGAGAGKCGKNIGCGPGNCGMMKQ